MVFSDEQQLLTYAKKLEGLRFSEISALIGQLDETHRKHTKGVAAKVIETEYFGIPTNSSEAPDFENLGIELKVSPLRYLDKKELYTTKERNVLKMVNYHEIAENEHWLDTKIKTKLNRILFVLYVHDNSKHAWEWKVVKVFLWSPSNEQIQLIQNDYEIMRKKVKKGIRLQEGDHTFFATCPKHGGYFRKDYNCQELAKPTSRADHPVIKYAEKRGYCIKREAFISLIAEAIDTPLITVGKTIGISSDKLEV